MPARSTRWIAALLVAAAAVVWLALRDDARDARDGRDASAAGRIGPEAARADDASADAELRGVAPLASDTRSEGSTELVPSTPADGARSAIPAPRKLALTLVDPRGAPVGGARWVAFRGDAVLASGTTSDEGAMDVSLAAPTQAEAAEEAGQADALELAVTCSGFHPLRAALAQEPAEQTIVLGAGAALSGVVRIDGAPPAEPFSLRLSADEPFWAQDELPEPVAVELMRRPRAVTMLGAQTAADGAFRFEGLAAGWSGRIEWSKCTLANPPPGADPLATRALRRVEVFAPRAGILLDLLSPPELVGRIVDPVSGAPVPRPFVKAAWSEGGTSTSTETTHAEDGTFRISFERELPARVQLQVGDSQGAAMQAHVVEIPPAVRRHDAGDLSIAWARTTAFRVTDPSGAPVAGASVTGVPGAPRGSGGLLEWKPARADDAGLGTIAVPPEATALRAVALGFEPALAALPAARAGAPGAAGAADDERVEIVLRPAATLELVLPPDKRDLGVTIVFGPDEPFLKDGAPSWEPEVLGALNPTMIAQGEGGFLRSRGAEDGRYVFGGLRPGLSLLVAAADDFGNRVGERVVPPLAAGERRVVELVVQGELGALWGRVVDSAGAPVPRASVMLGRVGDESYHGLPADEQGRFRVENLAAERVLVVVEAEGHPVRRFPALQVDGSPVELVLERGREVRIVVVGAQGEPVSHVWITPVQDGDTWWRGDPQEAPPGEYVVRDAPTGAIAFLAQVGGRKYPGRIEADEDSTRVVVGALQACTLVLAEPFAPSPGDLGTAYLAPLGAGPESVLHARVELGDTEVRFERVFPGRYEAYVEQRGPGGRQRLCDPVEVEVTAGADARVELVLRAP